MAQIVIFTKNNARILHVEDPRGFIGNKNAVIDPDLSRVKGVAPHYWKKVGSEILPMDEKEKADIDQDHKRHGVDNDVAKLAGANVRKRIKWEIIIPWGIAASACAVEIARHYL